MSKLELMLANKKIKLNSGTITGQSTVNSGAIKEIEKPNKGLDFGPPVKTTSQESEINILDTNLILTTEIGDWQGQELAHDAPELAKSLKDSLTHLQKALKSGDITTALYDTKVFIDSNPATKDLLHPEDINLFIRALQSSHSIVIAKKSTRKANKSATSQQAENLAAELSDLGDFTL